jgi:hypothetical protein
VSRLKIPAGEFRLQLPAGVASTSWSSTPNAYVRSRGCRSHVEPSDQGRGLVAGFADLRDGAQGLHTKGSIAGLTVCH